MQVETATSLISQLVLKPGWEVEAWQSFRFEGTVTLRFTYPTNNFNREEAPDYDFPIRPTADFNISVTDIDDPTDLYLLVLDKILEVEKHEWREAFRVAPTYWAPFHPHRLDGMKRWGEKDRDYAFGLA